MTAVIFNFSGPMLAIKYDDRVEVVIPRCDGAGMQHPDGTKALPHYAWLAASSAVQVKGGRAATFKYREQLIGTDTELVSGAGGLPQGANAFGPNFDITSLGAKLGRPVVDPLRDDRVAARFVLRGGELRGDGPAVFAWGWHDSIATRSPQMIGQPFYTMQWIASGDVNTMMKLRCDKPLAGEIAPIVQASRQLSFAAAEGLQIDVANLDFRTPENWHIPSLQHNPDIPFVDHDFKWIYHLFNADWRALLKDPTWGTRLSLPAPTIPEPNTYGAGGRPSCHRAWIDAAALAW